MKLEAQYRLRADDASDAASEAKKKRNEQISDQIDNKQEEIERLKKSMPSRDNRMATSPRQRIYLQKQILRKKDEIADLRLKRVQGT